MYLVNFSGLQRLARSWWDTCAGSPQRTKEGIVTRAALLVALPSDWGHAGICHITLGKSGQTKS